MSAPIERGLTEGDSAPGTTRRMPTRVSNACRRCRRNKSRCDSFRPCSLCVRADVQCEPAPVDKPPGSSINDHNQSNGRNQRKRRRSLSRRSNGNNDSTSVPPTRQCPAPLRHNVPRTTEQQPTGSRALGITDDRRSWLSVDYHEADSVMSIARKISRLGSQNIDDHQTSAIPDGRGETQIAHSRASDKRLPISTILGSRFPSQEMIYSLLEDYFDSVHWFSLVIYEPKFRQNLRLLEDGYAYPAELPFLALLSMVLCMAAWYRSKRTVQGGSQELRLWSADLLKIVESRLVQLMDDHSIPSVQTCILLGSHYVYHGRPNLAFGLLGATVKMAQAMSLHRNSVRGGFDDIEERKRVWWTIYTWDRFASISYGRPLSIDDADCNIEMPGVLPESPYFIQRPAYREPPTIDYSPYQTELSKLYLAASPALKTIFGSLSTQFNGQHLGSQYASLVREVTEKLVTWRHQLPPHLVLDLSKDYDPEHTRQDNRAHTLQSLSLQLTFDNLLIVLHRPILAQHVEHLSVNAVTGAEPGTSSAQTQQSTLTPLTDELSTHDDELPGDEATGSSEYWWSAAVRTARLTELPQLAQLATDSHLVAFMAMNLFHAAIVLISVALSDPLSNRAQGVKRTVTRVLRLQELLGQHSTLSSQSSIVLKNLVYLLLQREGQAMLGPVMVVPAAVVPPVEQQVQSQADTSAMSVEDTLRLPLEAALSTSDQRVNRLPWSELSRAQRLHESLASVQRVFPTPHGEPTQTESTLSSANGVDTLAESETQQQQQTWQMPFGQVNGYQGLQAMVPRGYIEEQGGNSLFWLWDANWGRPF